MAGVALMALDGALGSVLVAGDATNLWLVVPFCHLVGKPLLVSDLSDFKRHIVILFSNFPI